MKLHGLFLLTDPVFSAPCPSRCRRIASPKSSRKRRRNLRPRRGVPRCCPRRLPSRIAPSPSWCKCRASRLGPSRRPIRPSCPPSCRSRLPSPSRPWGRSWTSSRPFPVWSRRLFSSRPSPGRPCPFNSSRPFPGSRWLSNNRSFLFNTLSFPGRPFLLSAPFLLLPPPCPGSPPALEPNRRSCLLSDPRPPPRPGLARQRRPRRPGIF